MSAPSFLRGGARRRREPGFLRQLIGLALQLSLLALLTWGGWTGWKMITEGESFVLERIEVRGTERADAAELRSRLEPALGTNLVTLDLDPLRRAVEADPWVRSAVLRRKLPGTLLVEVRERTVGAGAWIEGERWLVDEEGGTIKRVGSGPAPRGPWLVGLDRVVPPSRPARLRAGVVALAAIRSHNPDFVREVAEIDLSDPRRAILRLSEGPEIWLPMERYPENLERFFRLRSQIDRVVGSIAYADLRWEDQIAVMPARGGS